MPRSFYRIAKGNPATMTDFRSRMEQCLPPRPIEVENPGEWAGLSIYDTREQAASVSRRWRKRGIGAFIAEVRLPDVFPDGVGIVARQTFRPGHYTIWGCAEMMHSL